MNKKTCETCKNYRNAFWYDWCMKYETTCENVIKFNENMKCYKKDTDENEETTLSSSLRSVHHYVIEPFGSC